MAVNTTPQGAHVVSCTGYPECVTSGFIPRGGFLKSRGTPCGKGCVQGFYEAEFHFPLGSVPRNGCFSLILNLYFWAIFNFRFFFNKISILTYSLI